MSVLDYREKTNIEMHIGLRILLLIFIAPSAYYFTYWVPFSLLPFGEQFWVRTIISSIVASIACWFLWVSTRNKSSKGLLTSVCLGAVIVGGIGFFAGFFGPIIFAPNSNQGPLLGIFITGPLGFLLGALGGFIFWFSRGRINITK